jgi:hypothetical protein
MARMQFLAAALAALCAVPACNAFLASPAALAAVSAPRSQPHGAILSPRLPWRLCGGACMRKNAGV